MYKNIKNHTIPHNQNLIFIFLSYNIFLRNKLALTHNFKNNFFYKQANISNFQYIK